MPRKVTDRQFLDAIALWLKERERLREGHAMIDEVAAARLIALKLAAQLLEQA